MNFNKTTEYALRIFGFIAVNEDKLYRAEDIYKNLNIPLRYLRKLLTSLSKSGLMISVQGKSGGYRLARKTSDISLLDIVQAMEDQQPDGVCFFGFNDCAFERKCAIHDKWASVRENINNVLSNTSLADLTDHETQRYIRENSLLITKND